MTERIGRFMEQWNMVSPADVVIVGISGGADSVCLCLVLYELSLTMGFTLRAVHVEHGIRGAESLADAAFTKQLCDSYGISCVVHSVDVPAYAKKQRIGEEEAARILRYEAFVQEAKQAARTAGNVKIALAHHMEDNAETMLFQLARGTGIDGLCGMQPVRTDEEGTTYIRPLLDVSRKEIEQFLAARGQAFCEDATNCQMKYSRNRIRKEVLPVLSSINVQAVQHMNQTARRLTELRDYTEQMAQAAYGHIAESMPMGICLDVAQLKEAPNVIQTRVIHRAIAAIAGGKKDIEAVHIAAVQALMERQTGRSVHLPYGIIASREYDKIHLKFSQAKVVQDTVHVAPEQLEQCLREPLTISFGADAQRLELRAYPYGGNLTEISSKMYTKCFDYDMIKNGFFIRGRKKGDYFVLDAVGHHKKLSDYMIDAKIPSAKRNAIPLIAQDAEILWMIGGRMSRRVMVTADTQMVLEIAYKGGTEDGLQQES